MVFLFRVLNEYVRALCDDDDDDENVHGDVNVQHDDGDVLSVENVLLLFSLFHPSSSPPPFSDGVLLRGPPKL